MESEDTLKNIYYEEMLLVIRLTLEKMPERRRLIFELSRFKELSYKEIAERLNISIRTVEHQVYLVLIELKKVLLFLFFLHHNSFLLSALMPTRLFLQENFPFWDLLL